MGFLQVPYSCFQEKEKLTQLIQNLIISVQNKIFFQTHVAPVTTGGGRKKSTNSQQPPTSGNNSNTGTTTTGGGGSKAFQCGMCEMSFDQNWLLKRHFRTHTKERPFRYSNDFTKKIVKLGLLNFYEKTLLILYINTFGRFFINHPAPSSIKQTMQRFLHA